MNKFGNILGGLIFLMITLSFISVVIRYVFNIVSIPLQEIIIYLHACAFMLGIVYTYHYDKHVRIDIYYQNYSKTKRRKVNLLGTVILLLPFFMFIFYASFEYVTSSWAKLEGSAESGGLPFVFGLKTLLLIMPLTVVVYSLYTMTRKI